MTFLWEASPLHGQSKQILTHIFNKNYGYPPGFTYEERMNNDDPLIKNKKRIDYNLDQRCVDLINFSRNISKTVKNK
jgi:hypothetical protein